MPSVRYGEYKGNRDFSKYPHKELESLFFIPEFEQLRGPLAQYLKIMQTIGLDEGARAKVAHAFASHLYFLAYNDLRDYAYFLLPPTVDPYVDKDPENGNGKILIAAWEEKHAQIRRDGLFQEAREIIRCYESGTENALTFLKTGSMYADKTAKILRILQVMHDEFGWHDTVHSFVAAALEEPYIQTREGGRANFPLEQILRLPAKMADFRTLMQELPHIDSGIVLIDEISFMAFAHDECLALLQEIERLNRRGVYVLAAGLDSNYRGEPLPFTSALHEHDPEHFRVDHCNAFFAYRDIQGNIQVGNERTSTSRIDTIAGISDVLLPVVIGRVHKFVKYIAAPPEANMLLTLKDWDSEAFELVDQLREQRALFDHYVELSAVQSHSEP